MKKGRGQEPGDRLRDRVSDDRNRIDGARGTVGCAADIKSRTVRRERQASQVGRDPERRSVADDGRGETGRQDDLSRREYGLGRRDAGREEELIHENISTWAPTIRHAVPRIVWRVESKSKLSRLLRESPRSGACEPAERDR